MIESITTANSQSTDVQIASKLLELSMAIKTQSTDVQSESKNYNFVLNYLFIHQEIVTVDESEHINLFEIQGKLGSLVLNIQKIVQSANVNIDDLKQLLILSYPFEELKKEIKV